MNKFQVKVYMIQVKPRDLILLQEILNGSVSDTENLIVDVGEIKLKSSKLKKTNLSQSIKDTCESASDEVEYIWFFL